MLVARTKAGQSTILIETIEEPIEMAGQEEDRQTEETGIEDRLKDAYSRLRTIVTAMADDFRDAAEKISGAGKKLELEYSLGLSASSGLWVISGKGECGVKVK